MASGGASYSPEGIDRHSQLTVLLNPSCAIILRAIIKYLVKLASPGGAGVAPWTLQQFLAHKRQMIESRHCTFLTTYEKVLYPTDGSEPNIESWDVSLLCMVIQKVCQPHTIAALQIDVDQIQRIRNEMSHLSHTNINEDDYNTYKNMLYVIMDRMLKILKDNELDRCISELKLKAEVEVPRNPDLARILHELCADNDETHTKLDAVHAGVLAILRKLDIPTEIETDVFMYLSKCNHEQQNSVSKTIVELIEANVERNLTLNSDLSSENMSSLKTIIEDIMKNLCSNGSTVLAARQKCIAIRMRCQTIGALCNLFEQSVDGTLTEMFRPIETFFRTLPGYETLEIEVNVIQRDYIRCIQQSVERLVESADHARTNLPVVRGVTVEQCDDESEDRRIRINLHPKTRAHLQHIRDACSSGQLDEQLAKMASILNSTYGSNMTIRSQLGKVSISETEKTLDTANEQEVFQAAVKLQSTKHVGSEGLSQTADINESKWESRELDNTLQEAKVKEIENADVIPKQQVKQEITKRQIQQVQSRVDADLVERKEPADWQDPQNMQSMEHLCDHEITTDVSVAAPKHGTRTDITKGDLEQDITQTRVENWQERLARLGVDSNVGNAKCDEYATIVDSFIKDAKGIANRNVLSDINTGTECGDLPACLRNLEFCQKFKQPLFKLSSFAFNTLFCQKRSSSLVFKSRTTYIQGLSNTELSLWRDIGLLSQDIVDTQRTKDAQIKFSQKTIQEFLAALYMSIHTNPDNAVLPIVKKGCGSVDMVLKMSQVFVFLSGMAPTISNQTMRYISQVMSADVDVQMYRNSCTSDDRGSDHVRDIQRLIIDCVRESVNSGQTNIEAHIQDIIIDDKVFTARQIDELIRLNKLDLLSVTVDLRKQTRSSGWTSDMQSEHMNRLKKFQVVIDDGLEDTDADAIESIIRRNQSTLKAISLCDVSSKRPPSELKSNVQSLPCIQEVALENVVFNCHQLEHIHTLRKLKLTNITCSHCSGPCCFDLSQLAQLQCLSLARYFSGNTVNVQINTSELVECQIEYWTRHDQHAAHSVTFHDEGQHLRRLSLTDIVLKHDQLVQLMLFVTKAAGLRKITLKKIQCSDCRTRCTCGLDFSKHSRLEELTLDEFDMSEVQINTTQLVRCKIRRLKPVSTTSYDPGATQTSLVFHDTGYLLHIELKNIMLKHDQFEHVIMIVTRATGLWELTLDDIKCSDCISGCTCRLDLSRHTRLRRLELRDLHVSEVNINMTKMVMCNIERLRPACRQSEKSENIGVSLTFSGEWQHSITSVTLRDIPLRHEHLEKFEKLEDGPYYSGISCVDCTDYCTIIGNNRRGVKVMKKIGRPKRQTELTVSNIVAESVDTSDDGILRKKLNVLPDIRYFRPNKDLSEPNY